MCSGCNSVMSPLYPRHPLTRGASIYGLDVHENASNIYRVMKCCLVALCRLSRQYVNAIPGRCACARVCVCVYVCVRKRERERERERESEMERETEMENKSICILSTRTVRITYQGTYICSHRGRRNVDRHTVKSC
jgi:hypothetical protein